MWTSVREADSRQQAGSRESHSQSKASPHKPHLHGHVGLLLGAQHRLPLLSLLLLVQQCGCSGEFDPLQQGRVGSW